MNKKVIVPALIILAILLLIAIIIFGPARTSPKIIERSVVQGDEVRDERTAVEACSSILPEVLDSNSGMKCALIDSSRIDSAEEWEKCVDGASVGGCFTCKFECS